MRVLARQVLEVGVESRRGLYEEHGESLTETWSRLLVAESSNAEPVAVVVAAANRKPETAEAVAIMRSEPAQEWTVRALAGPVLGVE